MPVLGRGGSSPPSDTKDRKIFGRRPRFIFGSAGFHVLRPQIIRLWGWGSSPWGVCVLAWPRGGLDPHPWVRHTAQIAASLLQTLRTWPTGADRCTPPGHRDCRCEVARCTAWLISSMVIPRRPRCSRTTGRNPSTGAAIRADKPLHPRPLRLHLGITTTKRLDDLRYVTRVPVIGQVIARSNLQG